MQFILAQSKRTIAVLISVMALIIGGCSSNVPLAENAPAVDEAVSDAEYRIGPRDSLQIFVWRNPELSTVVPVRPDGRISIPLVEDLKASAKTANELGRDIEKVLEEYIQDPIVTVIVQQFVGPYDQQIRVVGEATEPKAIAYNTRMTLLDVMIAVGGMTEFANGNDAVIIRKDQTLRVRIDDLLNEGDVSANVAVEPGDVISIPESWF